MTSNIERNPTANATAAAMPVFYRNRCVVCEDEMRRKREDQRFKIGHNTCKQEYQRFPRVYDPLESIFGYYHESDSTPLETPDSQRVKSGPVRRLTPQNVLAREKGARLYREPDLGECRLPSSHSASRARRPCQKLSEIEG